MEGSKSPNAQAQLRRSSGVAGAGWREGGGRVGSTCHDTAEVSAAANGLGHGPIKVCVLLLILIDDGCGNSGEVNEDIGSGGIES